MIAAAIFLGCPWALPARAEIFDGSGFEAINWNMRIADVERAMGNRVSRVRNEHTSYPYLSGDPVINTWDVRTSCCSISTSLEGRCRKSC
jgi:hypothetical protein